MKLSIIIPYYNVAQYTDELLEKLAPQIRDDVEVILIDDGSKEPYTTSYSWCKVFRKRNGGVSTARNMGMDKATGEYLSFIDADDLVADDYIDMILRKIPFDWLEMSWKSLPGGTQYDVKLNTDSDRLSNPSSVTRAFRRKYIGNVRFNEQKDAAEDAEFIKAVCKPGGSVKVITNYMYFYRTYTPNSLTKRYFSGDTSTKRIVYHYDHITSDMVDLLNEVRTEFGQNEVIILTNQNDMPVLEMYSDIKRPCKIRGNELRGEPWDKFIKIQEPAYSQVVIYTSHKHMCGIFTWILSFCQQMHDTYNIMVIHEGMDPELIERLIPYADVRPNGMPVRCDILLMMSIMDDIPSNIRYQKSYQVVHSTQMEGWTLPADRDGYIPVSDTVKHSWNISDDAILNMIPRYNELYLVTASRLKTPEKGRDRMAQLVHMLKVAGISFRWDCYSDVDPQIKGITYLPMTSQIRHVISAADYLVQLSDNVEGFCYSIVEALQEGTAVITTAMDVLPEIGFKDGEHGYVFPLDMDRDMSCLLNVPKFIYTYDNSRSKAQWCKLIGKSQGVDGAVQVHCIKPYRDMTLDRYIQQGEVLTVSRSRANEIISAGYAK